MNSFLGQKRPIITTILIADNPKDIIAEIGRASEDGAEAFCFQTERLRAEYRTRQNYAEIFQAMDGRPAYITCYRRDNASDHEQSDEELAEELLLALDCGATLCDVRSDMFDPCEGEFSLNDRAVEKQMKLIRDIHEMGGEVLMSSHVFRFLPKEQVCTMARIQQERGADIAKVVTMANSESELDENFEALLLLKRKLEIPSLFVCNGTHCHKHRVLGPLLGSCIYLTVENRFEGAVQPKIAVAKKVLEEMQTPILK